MTRKSRHSKLVSMVEPMLQGLSGAVVAAIHRRNPQFPVELHKEIVTPDDSKFHAIYYRTVPFVATNKTKDGLYEHVCIMVRCYGDHDQHNGTTLTISATMALMAIENIYLPEDDELWEFFERFPEIPASKLKRMIPWDAFQFELMASADKATKKTTADRFQAMFDDTVEKFMKQVDEMFIDNARLCDAQHGPWSSLITPETVDTKRSDAEAPGCPPSPSNNSSTPTNLTASSPVNSQAAT